MRWDDFRRSDNVEDRRGDSSGGGGFGIPTGGRGGLGIGTILVLGLLGWSLGIDPRLLIAGAEMLSGGGGPAITQPAPQNRPGAKPQDERGAFASAILGNTEDVWTQILPDQANIRYQPPGMVLFSRATRSGCGFAQSAMGPFYCPLDQKVYIDLTFFDEMKARLGGGGDFAYAYVIAHEVGHHVENVLGILPKVQARQREASQAQANALSVRVELMADCLAGVWAHHSDKRWRVLEEGDVEEAMRTAAAIGDDRLQKAGQGYAVPDSFTHGSSEQRTRWFMTGLKNGQIAECDTFRAGKI